MIAMIMMEMDMDTVVEPQWQLHTLQVLQPWHWALMVTAIVLTLPFQFLRRAVRGEGGAVGLKLRGWLDGLRDSDIPFSELGLR